MAAMPRLRVKKDWFIAAVITDRASLVVCIWSRLGFR